MRGLVWDFVCCSARREGGEDVENDFIDVESDLQGGRRKGQWRGYFAWGRGEGGERAWGKDGRANMLERARG
jgi:hypothetical protein